MSDICPVCGINLTLVGRAHNCKPIPKANLVSQEQARVLTDGVANTPGEVANTEGSTYRHRDPDKRREYMRNYMLKKRRGKL